MANTNLSLMFAGLSWVIVLSLLCAGSFFLQELKPFKGCPGDYKCGEWTAVVIAAAVAAIISGLQTLYISWTFLKLKHCVDGKWQMTHILTALVSMGACFISVLFREYAGSNTARFFQIMSGTAGVFSALLVFVGFTCMRRSD